MSHDPSGPTLDDVRREFPRWHTWTGVGGLLYASRRKTSPPAVMRAEDATGLLDEIRRWEHKHVRGT